jgi:hypothetical protein
MFHVVLIINCEVDLSLIALLQIKEVRMYVEVIWRYLVQNGNVTTIMLHIVAMNFAILELSEKKVQRNLTNFLRRRMKVIWSDVYYSAVSFLLVLYCDWYELNFMSLRKLLRVDFFVFILFFSWLNSRSGPRLPLWGHSVTLRHTHTHTHTHSVELLWKSDRPGSETSIWQHTPLKSDRRRHSFPRQDSNP